MPTRYEITPRSVFIFFAIIIGGWVLVQIRDILALLFVAFIIMSALRPAVDRLELLRIPRFLSIIVMYVLISAVIALFSKIVFPPLVIETARLINNLPSVLAQISPNLNFDLNILIEQIAPIGQNIARITVSVFSNMITLFTLIVFSFYFLLERNNLHHLLEVFVGDTLTKRMMNVISKVEVSLGAWVRGQLILALVIGFMSFIGLTILGVPYALPLALIAGVLEVIPIIGPIISAIPAILIALTVSPQLALVVFALYFIIQQLENNFLVPGIMNRTTGVPPIASLVALMVGERFGGTVGIILSIPLLLAMRVLIQEILNLHPTEK